MYSQKECTSCIECQQKSPIFELLSNDELEYINEKRYSIQYKAGEVILKQGTVANQVISLVNGFVKLVIEGEGNRNLILTFVKSWKIIGGPGIHTDQKHHYSVVALEDSRICFIDAVKFRELLQKNVSFANGLIENLSHKAVYSFDRLFSLTQKQMHGRMADGLIFLADEIYQSHKFDTFISRKDLADFTAMSKDSAIRILKEFERDGVIYLHDKTIEIIDMPQLVDISERG
jgi:CRP/FNR family transcriptional regulator